MALPERAWVVERLRRLNGFGPRHTGNAAHAATIDWLAAEFAAISNADLHVIRDSQNFTRWEAHDHGLRWEDAAGAWVGVPVAGYYPYAGYDTVGGTSVRRVEGVLTAGWPSRRSRLDNPIVVRRVRTPNRLMRGLIRMHTRHSIGSVPLDAHWPIGLEVTAHAAMRRAERSGAKGLVLVLDNLPPGLAVGQYVPFTRELAKIPAVYLDAPTGRAVLARIRQSGGGVRGELTLDHTVEPNASSDHVWATLPGSTKEAIIVATHSDGPNVFEENGVVGVLALAHHFSALPQSRRRRTIHFVCATGHFSGTIRSMDDFVERHEDGIMRDVRYAVVVEHLGATRADGPETAMAIVSRNRPLYALTRRIMEETLDHVRLLRPGIVGSEFFLGEGGHLDRPRRLRSPRVPTVGYLAGPPYLLSVAADGHLGSWSADRTMCELNSLRCLVESLLDLDG